MYIQRFILQDLIRQNCRIQKATNSKIYEIECGSLQVFSEHKLRPKLIPQIGSKFIVRFSINGRPSGPVVVLGDAESLPQKLFYDTIDDDQVLTLAKTVFSQFTNACLQDFLTNMSNFFTILFYGDQ
jgi:hypothetical protein